MSLCSTVLSLCSTVLAYMYVKVLSAFSPSDICQKLFLYNNNCKAGHIDIQKFLNICGRSEKHSLTFLTRKCQNWYIIQNLKFGVKRSKHAVPHVKQRWCHYKISSRESIKRRQLYFWRLFTWCVYIQLMFTNTMV